MRSVTDISVPQNEFICGFPVSEVNTDYILLYSFFWVIPQCSDFVCWLFGTLCPILYLSFRASKSIIYNKPKDATLAVLCLLTTTGILQSHFGHEIVQCATNLEHLYRIYSIPAHDKHQWLLLQFIVLLMMDAKGVQNM